MKRAPATEAVHPAARALDGMAATALVRLMAREEHAVARAAERAAPAVARLAEAVAAALGAGGRLI